MRAEEHPMSELKPCPGCGNAAPRHWAESDGKGGPSSIAMFSPVSCPCGFSAATVHAWNRRPPGYREGAEAMRERAAGVVEDAIYTSGGEQPFIRSRAASPSQKHIRDLHHDTLAAAIRALPLPSQPEPTK